MGYINIPVELCEYVIRNEFYRPMQLYIYLKTSCDGKVKKCDMDLQSIGEVIGLTSVRAVRNNLKILLAHNWVGYDRRGKNYFIRGFDVIRAFYGFRSRSAAEFDSRDILQLKAFVAAAKIGHLINCQKRKQRAAVRINGGTKQAACHSSGFYPVANEALAKLLGISISTAYVLKQLSESVGYIKIRKSYVKTGLSCDHANYLKVGVPERANKIIILQKQVFLQGVDMVRCNLVFRKREKIRNIYNGGRRGKQTGRDMSAEASGRR